MEQDRPQRTFAHAQSSLNTSSGKVCTASHRFSRLDLKTSTTRTPIAVVEQSPTTSPEVPLQRNTFNGRPKDKLTALCSSRNFFSAPPEIADASKTIPIASPVREPSSEPISFEDDLQSQTSSDGDRGLDESRTSQFPVRVRQNVFLTPIPEYNHIDALEDESNNKISPFDGAIHGFLYEVEDDEIRFNLIQRLFPSSISDGCCQFMKSINDIRVFEESSNSMNEDQEIQQIQQQIQQQISASESSEELEPEVNPQIKHWKSIIEATQDQFGTVLFYDNNQNCSRIIKQGSFSGILAAITDSEMCNFECVEAFLLTYRSFSSPLDLLELLISRFDVKIPHCDDPGFVEYFTNYKLKPIQMRTCNTLKHWIEAHWYDFAESAELFDRLVFWIRHVLSFSDFARFAASIEKIILQKIEKSNPSIVKYMETVPTPFIPKSDSILDFHPLECARQLCLLEFEDFAAIHPTELLHQNWQKSKKHILAPHICKIIQRSNAIPIWVATQILTCPDQKIKTRVKLIKKFIAIANECNNLNNFNSMMEIMAGLQQVPIYRLKKTWQSVPKKYLEIMDRVKKILSVSDNWKEYRTTIRVRNPPCIPYVGLYLTDVTFIAQGHPDLLECDGSQMINFIKCRQLTQVLQNLSQYQQITYSFQTVDKIRQKFQHLQPMMDSEDLYKLSRELEPS